MGNEEEEIFSTEKENDQLSKLINLPSRLDINELMFK